jgi:phosphatidylethanolamine-binding protein (PEBP) family uncharacterized protein
MRKGNRHAWILQLMWVLPTLGVAGIAAAAEPFSLSSSTFKDGALMPKKVSNDGKIMQNPNCVGENVSPQLSWSHAPEGTKSFALLMTDPEGRAGLGVVHWVAYGIAPSVAGSRKAKSARIPTSTLAERAQWEWGTTPGHVRPRVRRTIIPS